jgi:hypothetical protein
MLPIGGGLRHHHHPHLKEPQIYRNARDDRLWPPWTCERVGHGRLDAPVDLAG